MNNLENFNKFAQRVVEETFNFEPLSDKPQRETYTIELSLEDVYAIAHAKDFVEKQMIKYKKVGRKLSKNPAASTLRSRKSRAK
ncbi:MAG: hypothetical protein WA584_23515 [Pyrinomonadaceae bacterium]